jgi:ATP-dependent RNA helicase DDX6/DHH1
MLILDEADKLLSQDFKGMLDRVISHLPPSRQVAGHAHTNTIFILHKYDFHT